MSEHPERPHDADRADQEPTRPYPSFGTYPGPSGPPPTTSTVAGPVVAPPAPRRRRGIAAAALATVLVAGGAGYGGAALHDATQEDGGGSGIFAGVTDSGENTTTSTTAPSGSVQAVAASVLPSVVQIDVAGGQEQGSGSGIILSADGLILTNHHVVDVAGDGGQIRVDFNDGSTAAATIVGTDSLTDTAVIKAQDVSGLKPATIGKSGDLQVGQQVVAIGSPFGLSSTVTSGIVSALDRPVNVGSDSANNATVYPAIQTDAAINPGNSGGPLVDMSGRLVGINSSIRTTSSGLTEAGSIGLGFAIPIDAVGPIIDQMIAGEEPTHARLGITVRDVGAGEEQSRPQQPEGGFPGFGAPEESPAPEQPEDGSPFPANGAEIREVGAGSAAAEAGLKVGDIITKVDDRLIVSSDSLVATVRSYRPGEKVTVTYTRGGKEHTVTLTLDSDAGTARS
ncbi:MAG TPA: trypsin-like peptidase domain-containing protein [Nocardioides sp.]|uniref:S1C family serine protease n=1 Tax=Nocardioides sp. TaxID=35761 RepID=UPI002ED90375